MRRISFRLRSVLVASFFAGLAVLACSQGIGGRCVQDGDCASGFCQGAQNTSEGGRCAAPGSTVVPTTGTGGAAGNGAAGADAGGAAGATGAGGAAGATGTGGAAGATGAGGAAGATGAGGAAGASANGGHAGSTAGVAGSGGHDGGAPDAAADH
jgi:hypothetical protein